MQYLERVPLYLWSFYPQQNGLRTNAGVPGMHSSVNVESLQTCSPSILNMLQECRLICIPLRLLLQIGERLCSRPMTSARQPSAETAEHNA